MVISVDAVDFGLCGGVLVCESWLFQFVKLMCVQHGLEVASEWLVRMACELHGAET